MHATKRKINMKHLVVIGAGGHAKVIISTALESGWQIDEILDDNPSTHGTMVLGVPVNGLINMQQIGDRCTVIGIGNTEARRLTAQRLVGCKFATLVHPQSYVHSSCRLGAGTVVFAGAIIQPDSMVGKHAIVNTSASIDHECVIEHFAQIAPGVQLGGNVVIGEGAFVGIGASVIQNIKIGADTVVGAGAAVTRDLPRGVLAVGVPARIIGSAPKSPFKVGQSPDC